MSRPPADDVRLTFPVAQPEKTCSGTVRVSKNAPLAYFSAREFNMRMKMGFLYTMTNEVIEFDEGRRIAWQPRPAFRLGGRIWRYELESVSAGTRGTRPGT